MQIFFAILRTVSGYFLQFIGWNGNYTGKKAESLKENESISKNPLLMCAYHTLWFW